ncbi:MAG: PEGA domain-containing protein [Methanoregula sp.]|jgi:hypothetical protein|nr:PEGA domain-containing protein [Methanoregula sp.]
MVRIKNINISFILILLAALLIVTPSAAFEIAVYGDTAGFNPELHTDEFTLVYSLLGSEGTSLDANITKFTDPSVDVIFMGGDDTFTPDTASQLEQAVKSGKIFVVSYKNYQDFDASLPATTNGTVKDGKYLQVKDPAAPLSKTIFGGLREDFPNTDPFSSRPHSAAKPGSITLLSFDNKDPALLYWKYGNGYVIEWTLISNQRYLNSTEADLINARLMTFLLNPGVTSTTTPTTIITQTSTVPTQPDSGSISVYSSPLGASILIDGRYYGTTPANLTSLPAGNHIIRLALSGYYDYEGTVYVLAGQTTHAFGTLQPLNQYTVPPTAVPTSAAPIIIEVPATVEPTPTGPLENPGVLVAIIGVLTATIGAAATIFSHVFKGKKE